MSLKTNNIAVLGAGAWGTALACVMARNDHNVTLWGRDSEICHAITHKRENAKYLPGIKLAKGISASTDLAATCADADVILVVTPTQTTREICNQLSTLVTPKTTLIFCSKGIDRESYILPSQIAEQILPQCRIAALSGPSFAVDVARKLPTAVALAHDDVHVALDLANQLSGRNFRVYASNDKKGVELGGALKNVIAIAIGIARGLELGASAEAAMISRGFAELSRLALSLGATSKTLSGLSGLGDLVLTCSSTQSRNFSYGVKIGKGESVEGMPLAEGAKTVSVAVKLAKQNKEDCPMIAMTHLLIEGKISANEARDALLNRPIRREFKNSKT